MFDVFVTCDLYEPFRSPTDHHSVVTCCFHKNKNWLIQIILHFHLPFNFTLVSMHICTKYTAKYIYSTSVIVIQLFRYYRGCLVLVC